MRSAPRSACCDSTSMPAGFGAELEGAAGGYVIQHVAEEIDRAAEHGLGAIAVVGGIHAAILKDADVVHAAVGSR